MWGLWQDVTFCVLITFSEKFIIKSLDNFVQTQFILRVVNKEGLYIRHNIVFYVAIYSTGFRKPRGNSASIASNKYSKPAQSKEAMNIQQQQITLEMA